jgi:hypothetical protein
MVGANVKTISLGDSVVFNQRIQTGGSGLVQVLLADGTTFMVGPNSDLVIDSFVYDPNAGTAQVTASFTKGVLRFIGGQTSKTPNGVTINTPVGTMGIRGAMVDVVLDPPRGTPKHVDMLFGNEVTLEQGKKLLGRLYAAGYSLALGSGGNLEVVKTPPGWSSQIQSALAGGPGTKGGAPKGPGDDDVKKAAGNNSGKGVDKNTGNELSAKDQKQLVEAAAKYDSMRKFLNYTRDEQGFVGGVLNVNGAAETSLNATDGGEVMLTTVTYDVNGKPVSIKVPLYLSDAGGLYYQGGTGAGTLTATSGPTNESFATTNGYTKDHRDQLTPQEIADLDLNCSNCSQFVRWGFWGADISNAADSGVLTIDSMYITGNLSTAAQLQALGGPTTAMSATYAGDAVGIVNDGTNPARTASGDLALDWNFGSRDGSATISGFDKQTPTDTGRGFNFNIQSIGSPGFQGTVAGCSCSLQGDIQGAFVNNGNTAGGVIGNWGIVDHTYTAGGIFMGDRTSLTQNVP